MIELSQDSGARVILAGMQMPPNYGIAYAREFAAMYPALADEYGVSLIGFFLEGVALDPTLMQQDNIHPNAIIHFNNDYPCSLTQTKSRLSPCGHVKVSVNLLRISFLPGNTNSGRPV